MKLEEIERVLAEAYPGFGEPVLLEAEARKRAALVHGHMAQVNVPLELEFWRAQMPGFEAIGVPTYKLRGSKFDPDAPKEVDDIYKACGPGLNCGDLVKLSRACRLGDELIPKLWPNQFTKRLRDPDDHLAVIEELTWLGYWHSPKHVKHSYRQNPNSGKDVDWRFKCCEQIINLEVKYRRRDWVGVVDGPYFSRDFDSYFDDLEGKFGPQQKGELNVVGVSTLAPPDAGFRRCIRRFLDANPEVDAVILWSYHDPNAETPEIHSDKTDLIKLLFRGEDEESRLRLSPIRHLWRKSEERRALRPGEFPPELLGRSLEQ